MQQILLTYLHHVIWGITKFQNGQQTKYYFRVCEKGGKVANMRCNYPLLWDTLPFSLLYVCRTSFRHLIIDYQKACSDSLYLKGLLNNNESYLHKMQPPHPWLDTIRQGKNSPPYCLTFNIYCTSFSCIYKASYVVTGYKRNHWEQLFRFSSVWFSCLTMINKLLFIFWIGITQDPTFL